MSQTPARAAKGRRHDSRVLPTYHSIDEVAEAWGVTTRTIRRLIACGDLPARRIPGGRKLLIRAEDAEAALDVVPTDSEAS